MDNYKQEWYGDKYSGIGMNKLRELTKSQFCDFVLYVGKKTLIKRVPFEEYINHATEV